MAEAFQVAAAAGPSKAPPASTADAVGQRVASASKRARTEAGSGVTHSSPDAAATTGTCVSAAAEAEAADDTGGAAAAAAGITDAEAANALAADIEFV